MSSVSTVNASFAGYLKQLMPPGAVIHVGVGTGIGAMHQWRDWSVPRALLVEAVGTQLEWAEQLATEKPGWTVVNATLAETTGEAEFFHASNPAESGLVAPEQLADLWPNLRLVKQAAQATTRLDTLLETAWHTHDQEPLWLIVDCLPALRILHGASAALEQCSVLWLRALLQPAPDAAAGSTLEELESFLAPLGFRCVHTSESNHPAIGDAFFVRDWANWLSPKVKELNAALVKEREERANQAAGLQVQLDAAIIQNSVLENDTAALREQLTTLQKETPVLAQARDEQAKLASERQAKIGALEKERNDINTKQAALVHQNAALAARQVALEADVASLGKARDEQTKLAGDRQGQLDVLLKEKAALFASRDEQTKLAADKQAQLNTLNEQKTALLNLNASLTKDVTALTDQIAALQKQVATQTSSNIEQVKAAEGLQSQLKQLTQARDDLAKNSAEQKAKGDALEAEKKALADQLVSLQKHVATLTTSNSEQAKAAEGLQAQLKQLTQARDDLAKNSAEQKAKGDALEAEKKALVDQLAPLQKQVAALTASNSEQAKAAEGLQAQLKQLTQARDELSKNFAPQKARIETLEAEKKTLAEAKSKLEAEHQTTKGEATALAKARDEQTKLAGDRETQVAQLTKARDTLNAENQSLKSAFDEKHAALTKLEADLIEFGHRERQLIEEIVRAEAQIDLIKDLLLRESGI